MTQSRQSLNISIIYSIPLLLWVSAQLQFINWDGVSLQQLFRQTLLVLILLQVCSLALLFINRSQEKWQDDVFAILLLMFYPLPFLAIIWLTGSASISSLFNALAIVAATGAITFVIQSGAKLIPSRWRLIQTGLASTHILPAILIWNYRDLWQGWLV